MMKIFGYIRSAGTGMNPVKEKLSVCRRMIQPALLCLILAAFFSALNVYAEKAESTRNAEPDYKAVIDDQADLLTEKEEKELYEQMLPITEYGNAAFLSTDENTETPEKYCRNFYDVNWGEASGTVFLIDMANRKLWIFSRGDNYKIITTGYANSITDNVYPMATDEDYLGCAKEAFSQIYTLLSGAEISQPMKYISNAFMAVIISALLVLLYVHRLVVRKLPSDDEILEHLEWHCEVGQVTAVKTGEISKYNPHTSSSDGSDGGGSSGGGGGHGF